MTSASGSGSAVSLGRVEHLLLVLVLILKAVHLGRLWDTLAGYDVGDHLHRLSVSAWWMPDPGLRDWFYAYHPPLGFWLPRLLQDAGLPPLPAAQCWNTFCGVVAFLAVRETLVRLGLLARPVPVGALYLWAGFPIVVNSGISLNLDVMILAVSGSALLLSVMLWGPHPVGGAGRRIGAGLLLVLVLAGGLFIKFSSLLTAAVPMLVLFGFRGTGVKPSSLAGALLLPMLGLLLAWPYYHQRYFLPEGTYFPRNQDFWIPEELRAAREVRDRDRLGFIGRLLTPTLLQGNRVIEMRAVDQLRYSDVWRDFFIRDETLYFRADNEPASARGSAVVRVGQVYWWMMGLACLVGVLACVRSPGCQDPAVRLGGVMAGLGGLFVVAHLVYCYQDATPAYGVTKGIYILPATWMVAGLAVRGMVALGGLLGCRGTRWRWAGFCLLAGWLAVNYLVPIY